MLASALTVLRPASGVHLETRTMAHRSLLAALAVSCSLGCGDSTPKSNPPAGFPGSSESSTASSEPEVQIELSNPKVARVGPKMFVYEVQYRFVKGQPHPKKWYSLSVSFEKASLASTEMHGTELKTEGTIRGDTFLFSDEPTKFEMQFRETPGTGPKAKGSYKTCSNKLSGTIAR
jgi:hypothetical protein